MTNQYRNVRMPIEAYNRCREKKIKMEDTYTHITKKRIRIPMTKVWNVITENPVTLSNEYILGIPKQLKRRYKTNVL